MTNFLTVDDVVRLHDTRVPNAPVIDAGKLDSAVNRPRNLEAYGSDTDIHMMAAALCEGICQAHGFADGNKRAALLSTVAFYTINGYVFDAPNDADLLHLMVDLTTHDVDAAKAAEMFSFWATPRPDEDDAILD